MLPVCMRKRLTGFLDDSEFEWARLVKAMMMIKKIVVITFMVLEVEKEMKEKKLINLTSFFSCLGTYIIDYEIVSQS